MFIFLIMKDKHAYVGLKKGDLWIQIRPPLEKKDFLMGFLDLFVSDLSAISALS